MLNRRTFAILLASAPAMRGTVRAQQASARTVFYASVGPELFLYDVDVEGATLNRRSSVILPAGVQYAWPHPSKRFHYVASSNGLPGGGSANRGDRHHASAFRINPATGALTPHGQPRTLQSRPIHISIDRTGNFAMVAYNDPSAVTVHRIESNGTLGAEVVQQQMPDAGIYAHQILATPSNEAVILVCRGNNPAGGRPEDPGSVKVFGLSQGQLTGLDSLAPNGGYGFGPRHLDFGTSGRFVYVSLERQNMLYTYGLGSGGTLSPDPLFRTDSLAEPGNRRAGQGAGTVHVHPNGRFVYQANRNSNTVDFQGRQVFAGGENNMAVFSIDQTTGEPTLIQNADGHANQLRTFALDPSGRMLVATSIAPILIRNGDTAANLSAGLTVYRVGTDGKLTFMRKYDVDTSNGTQFWSGMFALR